MNKMASLELQGNIYNWLLDFFTCRNHCTRYAGQRSTVAEIKASVIQVFGVGPSSYIITAGDLHSITPGNRLFKLADDTYLVVPEANTNTRTLEIGHIPAWAAMNNLALNCSKSKEMIIRARGKRGKSACPPPPCSYVERVTTLRVLGVMVNNQLTADHVTNVLASCNSRGVYPLRGHDAFPQRWPDAPPPISRSLYFVVRPSVCLSSLCL